MKPLSFGAKAAAWGLSLVLLTGPAYSVLRAVESPDPRVAVRLNTDEADCVLAVLDSRKGTGVVDETLWRKLFASEPYQRLKKREEEIGRRFNVPDLKFSDEDFKRFVLSPELAARASELERVLRDWKDADLRAMASRILAYLPDDARIRAKVFPVIKPRINSFVYDLETDPTVFLYLDPGMTREQFENTVAHEMHHIGFASIESEQEKRYSALPPNVRAAADWIGAFGEGFAMLAAAGGPDIHPHAASSPETRARWDNDMGRFDRDLKDVERFLLDVIEGRFATKGAADEKGSSFFGVQGPWYTVGYKMAVTVEKRYGRARLIQCQQDPRWLLRDYNSAVSEGGAGGAVRWSPELLKALGLD
jgi:hypothetical protein